MPFAFANYLRILILVGLCWQAIILSPAREIAVQTARKLQRLAGCVECLDIWSEKLTFVEEPQDTCIRVGTELAWGKDNHLRSGSGLYPPNPHVWSCTAGRLKQLVGDEESDPKGLFDALKVLAVDEADMMLQDSKRSDSKEPVQDCKDIRLYAYFLDRAVFLLSLSSIEFDVDAISF